MRKIKSTRNCAPSYERGSQQEINIHSNCHLISGSDLVDPNLRQSHSSEGRAAAMYRWRRRWSTLQHAVIKLIVNPMASCVYLFRLPLFLLLVAIVYADRRSLLSRLEMYFMVPRISSETERKTRTDSIVLSDRKKRKKSLKVGRPARNRIWKRRLRHENTR